MQKSTQHIIFSGAFDIGEVLSPAHLATVRAARQLNGDQAVFVGDIGMAEKLGNYIRLGSPGLQLIYRRRIDCAVSGCMTSQLPALEELEEVIDLAAWDQMHRRLQDIDSHLATQLMFIPVDMNNDAYQALHPRLNTILRQHIIPEMVRQRCIKYGWDPKQTTVYSEREMRNRVQYRLRTNRAHQALSWQKLIDQAAAHHQGLYLLLTELPADNKTPRCRGIMLALYETLALQGYEHVTQLYPEKQYLAIKNAEELYHQLQHVNPQDTRWQMTFADRFYPTSSTQ